MIARRERYPFVQRDPAAGAASLAPLLTFRLRLAGREERVVGMIDTGAAVSVIPWSVGLRLGGDWDASVPLTLTGNLVFAEARALLVEGSVGGFSPRRLVFAWSKSDAVPVLLGQTNFLVEFDIYLSLSSRYFDIIVPDGNPAP